MSISSCHVENKNNVTSTFKGYGLLGLSWTMYLNIFIFSDGLDLSIKTIDDEEKRLFATKFDKTTPCSTPSEESQSLQTTSKGPNLPSHLLVLMCVELQAKTWRVLEPCFHLKNGVRCPKTPIIRLCQFLVLIRWNWSPVSLTSSFYLLPHRRETFKFTIKMILWKIYPPFP